MGCASTMRIEATYPLETSAIIYQILLPPILDFNLQTDAKTSY